MIKEIPAKACLRAESRSPKEHGALCLRLLVMDLNKQGTEAINAPTDAKLRVHATVGDITGSSYRCPLAHCEATTPITPELYQLLSERSL